MSVLSLLSIAMFAVSAAVLVAIFLNEKPDDVSLKGSRGFARQHARKSSMFRLLEPMFALLGKHVSRLPFDKKRKQLDRTILLAGEYHGLGPDELMVVMGFSGVFGAIAGAYFLQATDGILIPLACFVLGPMLPSMQLKGLTKERHKSIDRGLPMAIDLAALCMSAGLDFPGALQHVVDNMPNPREPIRQELERILQELSLGHTRRQALESFAKRVDTEAVVEFVASVVQAEEKGTPLSTVLSIQAGALRGRRSVMAEEAAARAGVMLMMPMVMMMGSIVVVLMGPLILDMMDGGLM